MCECVCESVRECECERVGAVFGREQGCSASRVQEGTASVRTRCKHASGWLCRSVLRQSSKSPPPLLSATVSNHAAASTTASWLAVLGFSKQALGSNGPVLLHRGL